MFFKFDSFIVEISSSNPLILDRLARDFSFFLLSKEESSSTSDIHIVLEEEMNFSLFPEGLTWKNSCFFNYADHAGFRYLNYGNKLLAKVDFKNETAVFCGKSLHLQHEIAYLYILSRVGKKLEKKGYFKIHASGVGFEGQVFLFPMMMKGGKTTLLLNLLSLSNFSLLADDAPLVDLLGHTHPFPIRIGMENPGNYPCYDSSKIYLLERRRFGMKYLVDVADLKNPIAKKTESAKIVLFKTERKTGASFSCKRKSAICFFPLLAWNLILGIGLPYAREFYLEGTIKDFFVIIRTGFMRTIACIRLLKKADCYALTLGDDPKTNAKNLLNFWGHDCREDDESCDQTSYFT